MSVNPLSSFVAHPDDYLLQVKSVKGQQQLGALKKGIWTWLKIHLGSRLGLFDKSSLKLSEVAKYVLTKESLPEVKNPKAFFDAFDYHIERWNSRHSKFEAISTKNEHPNSFQIKYQHPIKWVEMKEDNEVYREIMKKIPQHCFDKIDVEKLPAAEGNLRRVKLISSPLNTHIEKRGFPNLEKIASYLNGDTQDGAEELQKAASLGKKSRNILF